MGHLTYIGMKCSTKHDKNRDSARPARPVAGDIEKAVLSVVNNNALVNVLGFFDLPALSCSPLAPAVRGRPSLRLVEYAHCTPVRTHLLQGISPVHLLFLRQQLSQAVRSKEKARYGRATACCP